MTDEILFMTANIILWTRSAPDPLAQKLQVAGYQVWEALAFSEVTYLCDTEKIDVVVIRSEVDDAHASALRRHYMTIKLQPNTEPSEIIDALWNLFPGQHTTVQ